jgi:hypothetical protein
VDGPRRVILTRQPLLLIDHSSSTPASHPNKATTFLTKQPTRFLPLVVDLGESSILTKQPMWPSELHLSSAMSSTLAALTTTRPHGSCHASRTHGHVMCVWRSYSRYCHCSRGGLSRSRWSPAQEEASCPGVEVLQPRLLLWLRRPTAYGGGGRTKICRML